MTHYEVIEMNEFILVFEKVLPMIINAVNNESDIDCFLCMFLLRFFSRICFRAYFPHIKFCAIPLYLWDL